MLMKLVAKFAASLAVLGLSFNVLAAELNVYASMPEKYASQVLEQFTRETGIKVNFLRLSSGEVLSRLQAEKSNPQVDVLLGGPADYLEVAKNEGLTAPYKPKGSDFIPAEFKDPQNYWTGIGIMPLAFITNNNFLKKNNLKAPTSWQDFLKPEYKEDLILADARTSGTATERLFSLERVSTSRKNFTRTFRCTPRAVLGLLCVSATVSRLLPWFTCLMRWISSSSDIRSRFLIRKKALPSASKLCLL